MEIKILGTDCPNCKVLEKNVRSVVGELGLDAEVEKIEDIAKVMSYGVMSIPALVVDGVVVSYGKVLNSKEIKALLE